VRQVISVFNLEAPLPALPLTFVILDFSFVFKLSGFSKDDVGRERAYMMTRVGCLMILSSNAEPTKRATPG